MPFSGSPAQLMDDVATYQRLGVSHVNFDFRKPGLNETLERMDWFAQEVMARVR